MSQGDDELDWFDQDEDDLVNNLKKNSIAVLSGASTVEFITTPASLFTDDPAQLDCNINSSSLIQKTIATFKLREVAKMRAMDAFLFASTAESDFFNGQIRQNDSIERVLLYVQVLVLIINLELPGYEAFILKSIAKNEHLLQHFCSISKKLFSSKYKSMWTDTSKVDEILANMEVIFLRILQVTTLPEHYLKVISQISMLIKSSDEPSITKRLTCISLRKTIDEILSEGRAVEDLKNSEEIFPNLEELVYPNKQALQDIAEISKSSLITKSYKNNSEYIDVQKYLLREDFMISLRDYVKSFITTHKSCFPDAVFVEDVHIVLNEQFPEAKCQLVFADLLGSCRSLMVKKKKTNSFKRRLNSLKSGTLLCFTTSFDFENLILATVEYTDSEILSEGFISIDVVKQYNIGSIYNKKFLMFKSPAFFEPYHNVYNVIKTYATGGAGSIPMQRYIVAGEVVSDAPAYLKQNSHQHLENLTKDLNLNECQQSALKKALCEEFCLIQGPPGTGKTYLSVRIVKTLIEKTNSPLVIITYTNDSLDKFLLKLSAHTDSIVRFGIGSKNPDLIKFNVKTYEQEQDQINPLIKRLYYITRMLYKEEFEALQKLYKDFDGTDDNYKNIVNAQKKLHVTTTKLKTIKIFFQYELVKTKQVIAMTTTCAAKSNYLFKLLESPIVVFEEAAEILESHVIACLTRFTQHVIMIGDHMQLQPYTSSYQHSRVHEMNISLFERLINRGMAHSMLRKQYRMRPEIVRLICPLIYNELQSEKKEHQFPQVKGMKKNVFFLSHKEMENNVKDSSSKYNEHECMELLKLTEYLITKEYATHEIVVLSPYTEQIEHISKKLRANPILCKVKAHTVDSFQGMEAEIVLLSLVRSNTSKDIGFLNQKNRICVALSRAMNGLFIIGNMSLLSECSKIWKEIEATLSANDAIGDEFPFA